MMIRNCSSCFRAESSREILYSPDSMRANCLGNIPPLEHVEITDNRRQRRAQIMGHMGDRGFEFPFRLAGQDLFIPLLIQQIVDLFRQRSEFPAKVGLV
jgi:hypothetical protein